MIFAVIAALAAGCAARPQRVQHASSNAPPRPYHLHLNGIGGLRSIDRGMLRGLVEGGLEAEVEAYDWTGSAAGMGALIQQKLHVEQARIVAQMLEGAERAQPGRRITISAHSAGAGIIAWALADLPPGMKVDSLVLLAPALSPTFDLSAALRHVSGHVYVFYSPYDAAVLGLGTRLFGTVDGVKTSAAGEVGFKKPPGADDGQYAKLVQIPYQISWAKLGNIGDHIGPMSRPFARQIIAPLLLWGKMPATAPSTRPARQVVDRTEGENAAVARSGAGEDQVSPAAASGPDHSPPATAPVSAPMDSPPTAATVQ